GGGIPERQSAPEASTVALRSHRNASPFWIILLLRLPAIDRRMTDRLHPNKFAQIGKTDVVPVMSALLPKADVCSALADVRYGPEADIAPNYSITSSARTKNDCRTERPSALADWRLITSSNLSGDCAGKFPTASPLRMRSTYALERRKISAVSGP